MNKMRNCICAIILLAIFSGVFCEECISGPSELYSGSRSTTKSGITCQRWDAKTPHEVTRVPKDGGHHNQCRNPDKDSQGTWCYTTDPSVRWEFCEIPKCDDNVFAVWAGYDEDENSAYFELARADPEMALKTGLGSLATRINKKVFKNAQFRGLEVSKDGEEIYFIDVKNNYFGVFNTDTFKVKRYLQGNAEDIHAIAQDQATGRFYWTDTKTKSVMSADRKFKSKVAIYNAAPSEPRAIAVLPGKGGIVFSTYIKRNTKVLGAEIIKTNIKGKKAKVLFRSPDVVDVTGIAVDEERIYWTDNLGYASRVVSCTYKGRDKVEHYFRKYAVFQDIALYSHYIYVTDSKTRYNYFDHIRYNVDVIRKDPESDQIFTYSKPNVPHGIAILSKDEKETVPAKFVNESGSRRKSRV